MHQKAKEQLGEMAFAEVVSRVSDAVHRAMASPRYRTARRVVSVVQKLRDPENLQTPEDARRLLEEAQEAALAWMDDEASRSEEPRQGESVPPGTDPYEPEDQ